MKAQDRPQVIVFPPLVPLVTVVSSVAMQVFLPLHMFARLTGYVRLPIGAALLLAGAAMTARGGRALQSGGTNVQSSLPSLVLVDKGIYGWTRNPMYVGGSLAMFGAAFLFRLDWLPLIFPASLAVLHFGIIKREERYLEARFGEEYLRYATRVPRYLGVVAALRLKKESAGSV
jgi:protein-S-isoprenylcysteine O-methyltransferase Ste14